MMEHQLNSTGRDENFSPQSRSTCHFGEENEIHPSNFRHFSQSSKTLLHIIKQVYYAINASSTSLSHAHLNSVSFQHARPLFREITFRRSRQNTLYSQERTNSSTSVRCTWCVIFPIAIGPKIIHLLQPGYIKHIKFEGSTSWISYLFINLARHPCRNYDRARTSSEKKPQKRDGASFNTREFYFLFAPPAGSFRAHFVGRWCVSRALKHITNRGQKISQSAATGIHIKVCGLLSNAHSESRSFLNGTGSGRTFKWAK